MRFVLFRLIWLRSVRLRSLMILNLKQYWQIIRLSSLRSSGTICWKFDIYRSVFVRVQIFRVRMPSWFIIELYALWSELAFFISSSHVINEVTHVKLHTVFYTFAWGNILSYLYPRLHSKVYCFSYIKPMIESAVIPCSSRYHKLPRLLDHLPDSNTILY